MQRMWPTVPLWFFLAQETGVFCTPTLLLRCFLVVLRFLLLSLCFLLLSLCFLALLCCFFLLSLRLAPRPLTGAAVS
jgi:hypothetical protein